MENGRTVDPQDIVDAYGGDLGFDVSTEEGRRDWLLAQIQGQAKQPGKPEKEEKEE